MGSGQPTCCQGVEAGCWRQGGQSDHFGALRFLQGFLVRHPGLGVRGLVVVIAEVETSSGFAATCETRDSMPAAAIDEVAKSSRFPGLYCCHRHTLHSTRGRRG